MAKFHIAYINQNKKPLFEFFLMRWNDILNPSSIPKVLNALDFWDFKYSWHFDLFCWLFVLLHHRVFVCFLNYRYKLIYLFIFIYSLTYLKSYSYCTAVNFYFFKPLSVHPWPITKSSGRSVFLSHNAFTSSWIANSLVYSPRFYWLWRFTFHCACPVITSDKGRSIQLSFNPRAHPAPAVIRTSDTPIITFHHHSAARRTLCSSSFCFPSSAFSSDLDSPEERKPKRKMKGAYRQVYCKQASSRWVCNRHSDREKGEVAEQPGTRWKTWPYPRG